VPFSCTSLTTQTKNAKFTQLCWDGSYFVGQVYMMLLLFEHGTRYIRTLHDLFPHQLPTINRFVHVSNWYGDCYSKNLSSCRLSCRKKVSNWCFRRNFTLHSHQVAYRLTKRESRRSHIYLHLQKKHLTLTVTVYEDQQQPTLLWQTTVL